MRLKTDYRSVSRNVYNKFCSTYPDIKISFEKWKEIVYAFNYELRDYILNSGEKVRLPWGVGPVAINKKKSKKIKEFNGKQYVNLPVNWKRTKEVGKTIYYTNSHTDGHRCKWMWFSKEAKFASSEIWNFRAYRKSSRKLKDLLFKPNSQHAQIYKNWQRKY